VVVGMQQNGSGRERLVRRSRRMRRIWLERLVLVVVGMQQNGSVGCRGASGKWYQDRAGTAARHGDGGRGAASDGEDPVGKVHSGESGEKRGTGRKKGRRVVSEAEQALRDEAMAKKKRQEQLSESDEERCRLEEARQRGAKRAKKEKGEGGEPDCSKDSMLPVKLNFAGPACNTVPARRSVRVRPGGEAGGGSSGASERKSASAGALPIPVSVTRHVRA